MAYKNFLHTIVETPEFVNAARRLLGDAERAALIDFLASNPMAGDLMRGTAARASCAGRRTEKARAAARE